MKIAVIAPSPIPFVRGGIENLSLGLVNAVNNHTQHSAELIKLPIREDNFFRLLAAYWRFHRLKLDHFDLLIHMKYPTWMTSHPDQVVYMAHRLRGLYDTYETAREPVSGFMNRMNPFRFPGGMIKKIIHFLDDYALSPSRISHYFSISGAVRDRPGYFPADVAVEVIHPPPLLTNFRPGEFKHLLTVSRLDGPKRIDWIIQAMQLINEDISLIIAGSGPLEDHLRSLAAGDTRIRFTGAVSDEELIEYYADALAVVFIPLQEDYGYVAVEAMKCSKPVITMIDSGGPLDFVEHGASGLVAAPDVRDLAEKITRLVKNRSLAEVMGKEAYQKVQHINWKSAVTRLLKNYGLPEEKLPGIESPFRRLLVLVPYSSKNPQGGGQVRVYELYRKLARWYDVWLLALGKFGENQEINELAPQLREVVIPPTPPHARNQWELEKAVGEAVSDVAAPGLLHLSPNFARVYERLSKVSDVIIASHPYFFPLIKTGQSQHHIVHDSHNFEYELKKEMLSAGKKGKKLLKQLYKIEKQAVAESELLWATSETEAEQLKSFYKAETPSLAVPNGVDTESIMPPENGEQRRKARKKLTSGKKTIAVFIGSWHPPNLEALEFIQKKIAPKTPNIEYQIIGSVKDQYEARRGNLDMPENIRMRGVVSAEDKKVILDAADMALNPMFHGSGTNLKLFEYMAAGLPVITTSLGCRGVSAVEDEHLLVREAELFTSEIISLAENEEKRQNLGSAAREYVKNHFDWNAISEKAMRSLEKLRPRQNSFQLQMDDHTRFVYGWHSLEEWPAENNSSSLMLVRWSSPVAALLLPNPAAESSVTLSVQNNPLKEPLKCSVRGINVYEGTPEPSWVEINLNLPAFSCGDFLLLELECSPWIPDLTHRTGDLRKLGIALKGATM